MTPDIYDIALVSDFVQSSFASELQSRVESYQAQGLSVEVQFSTSATASMVTYSALVIARKQV